MDIDAVGEVKGDEAESVDVCFTEIEGPLIDSFAHFRLIANGKCREVCIELCEFFHKFEDLAGVPISVFDFGFKFGEFIISILTKGSLIERVFFVNKMDFFFLRIEGNTELYLNEVVEGLDQ